MPLQQLESANLRSHCKEIIETTELWLRRYLHDELHKKYGTNYFNVKRENGDNLIKSTITKDVLKRSQNAPLRFPRPVDALTLEETIKIICNPELYRNHFSKGLKFAFPDGREECFTFLSRLILPRNKLYHSNLISIREAEKIICYSRDVIDSLKIYYTETGVSEVFNVPSIYKITDSFGEIFTDENFIKTIPQQWIAAKPTNEKRDLSCGDTLRLEAFVDESFTETEYIVRWSHGLKPIGEGKVLNIKIEEKHIGETFSIRCTIIQNKEWHKFSSYDHRITLACYRVLPPT